MKLITDIAVSPGEATDAKWGQLGLEELRDTLVAAIEASPTRLVNRSLFHTAADPRLAFLVGMPSPVASRRNPQTTIELRDLPGSAALIETAEPATHGVARLGPFILLVSERGDAELRMPAGTALTIRTTV